MHNLRTLFVSTLGALLLAGLTPAETAAQGDRPNIIFILTEDGGAFDSVAGTAGVQTPGLESIANRGVYFNNAHVAGSVCSVSKAALLTGMMPHSNNLRTNVVNFYPGASGIAAGDIAPGDTTGRLNQMIAADATNNLNSRFRIHDDVPTFVEILKDEGYYTGVTHKLHVSGVDRFQYDHWIDGQDPSALNKVANGAAAAGEPFFLLFNTPDPHRPYTNGDTQSLTVDPNEVVVPEQFVDTPVSRQDWAEHLDGVEAADTRVVDVLDRLDNLGLTDDTIVVYMSDHGPSWHRGKQSTYDFGSRVSLAIAGPGITSQGTSDTVVNEIDLMPTLLDLIGVTDQPQVQGQSIAPLLQGAPAPSEPRYSVTEIQHDVRNTDDGQNEKKITDGEYSLIFRFNHTERRELNADQYVNGNPWRNRIYDETIRVYDDLQQNPGNYTTEEAERINRSYRLLDEMDSDPNRNYDLFVNEEIELYHNAADPYELNNIVNDASAADTRDRLLSALHTWTLKTNDTYVDARLIPAPGVAGDHFEGRPTGSNLGNDSMWSTRIAGNGGADFTFTSDDKIDAPAGPRALATFDDVVVGDDESFVAAVDVDFTGAGVGAGLVFGYVDTQNFYEFQLLDGDSTPGGLNKDVRLVEMKNGVQSVLFLVNDLENVDRNEAYRLIVDYDAGDAEAELLVVNEHGIPYFSQDFVPTSPLAGDSLLGISTWSTGNVEFGRFDLQVTPAVLGLEGDYNGDGMVTAADYSLWRSSVGEPTEASLSNNGDGQNGVDQGDYALWTSRYGDGTQPPVAATVAVPEPTAALGAAALGLTILPFARRAKRK